MHGLSTMNRGARRSMSFVRRRVTQIRLDIQTAPLQPAIVNKSLATPNFALATLQRRFYGNLGGNWGLNRTQYTKYRISKPWTADSTFDDLYLAEPSKDDFYSFTKDMPIFLKFLDMLTSAQNRKQVFLDFVKRCENGLVVERDVYITKQQLLDCMWANGYTQQEIDALKLAFPDDYQFHYPELAVLFDLEESDCYQYCLRQRAANPEELVQLKLKKPQNLISSYGLIFLGCWFGLCNAVLGNAWFFAKTLPFGAVFYMLAAYFQREIKAYFWKQENALVEGALQEKQYCEAAIYSQLTKYFNDSKCKDQVEAFKPQLQEQMKQYRTALITRIKQEATAKLNAKLRAMASEEAAIASELQLQICRELLNDINATIPKDAKFKDEAIESAICNISGEENKDKTPQDPIFKLVDANLKALEKNDTSRPIVKKCNDAFEQLERNFINSHSIHEAEHKELLQLAEACNGQENGDLDLSKLDQQQLARLDTLFKSINARMGYHVPNTVEMSSLDPNHGYSNHVLNEATALNTRLYNTLLTNFLRSTVN